MFLTAIRKSLFFFLLIANSVFAQVNLNQGLKAYYPFTGNANDVSGNNNNPVFNNAALTTDRFGNPNSAYHFNGSSSYMQILNSPSVNSTNKISLVAWVRPMGFYTGTCHGNSVMMKGDADYLTGNYLMRFDDNAYTNGTNCGGGPVDVLHQNFYGGTMAPPPGYTPYIQVNQWYSVIITMDGTTAKLYVDCQLKASGPQGGQTFTNAYDLYFGKLNNPSFPYWFNGDLDEVRIYDRDLTVDEVNVLGSCNTGFTCTNWLRTQAVGQSVTVGDLDVSGNQVTVEANFNCSSFPTTRPDKQEDIVSKHSNTTDINYVLRMDLAGITTTNGQFLTPFPCDNLVTNKTYHVALVYNGTTLKFYRNGFLMSQIAATGNLVLNNWLTTIGDYAVNNPVGTNFLGYINEVRIWNVARTQAQLQAYMNISLPNPTTQPGLLGYYTFDNLLNKQGNAAYNGTLNGAATINNTNPNCSFLADSCPVTTVISNIINTYTPVLALSPCDNKLTVADASTFNTGDTVLMIQMKGAVIDSTNTAAFGTIIDYKNAGNYEFNYVKSKTGNVIELKNKLTRQYDIPVGKVQLIRVPYYSTALVSATLTCPPWDGSKGGVLVLNARDSVILNADIDANGKGFIGGQVRTTVPGTGIYNQTDYAYPLNPVHGSYKGEGIAEVSNNLIFCRGPLFSGGGGGNSSNSGGGGGGNSGSGGKGGNEWAGAPTVLTNGGVGGRVYAYSSANNKIFMGGAGGAGHANDNGGTSGGNGGGIVIINTNTIKANAYKITANGAQGPDCLNLGTCADGVGGGGAGGTVLLNATTAVTNFPIIANGGKGADNNVPGPNAHGPGGGGGGGTLLVNSASLLANITYSSAGGAAGRALNHGNTNWGAVAGTNGTSFSSFIIPNSTVPFTPNIDSVRIKDSLLSCSGFDFKGLAYTNTNPISTWQWYFGDGGTANTQNTTYAYSVAGTYTVKLIVTDINGCVDSVSKDVTALPGIVANAGNDTAFCSNSAVSYTLQGTGAGTYSWTPAVYLNNPTIQNPIATVSATTTFYLTVTGASACSSIDSVTIYVNPVPLVQTIADTSICANDILVLTTTSGLTTYHWTPGISVSDSTIASPVFTGNTPVTLVVTGTNTSGCFARDTILVNVKPLPLVRSIADSAICSTSATITLTTTGAQTYSWTPAIFLSNPNIANPVFTGNQSQTYYVTGTAANGCKAKDTVNIYVTAPFPFLAPPDKTMCQNNSVQLDGYNGTAVQYLWSPATYLSNPTIINPIANPPATITYAVKITNQGCNYDSTFNVVVTVLPKLPVTAGKLNDIDCANRTAQLFASGGTTYTWIPATGLNDPNIPNPVATLTSNQTYIVNVSDANGCSNIDSVTVLVNRVASLARYIPNTFTPNGDGLNDCYGLKNWMYIKKLEFRIFNRYGEQVFATADPSRCWDGRYKGKIADQGSYVFYIKAETNCGTEEQKGSFMLLR
ncbi:MAG TPA: gliding motility-associated C-terminal domain-containing protein [Ferruginibacter sp.]|nr:gliding motility-associated C-terminal domain-containing protein [Ferruginibacter sp.]